MKNTIIKTKVSIIVWGIALICMVWGYGFLPQNWRVYFTVAFLPIFLYHIVSMILIYEMHRICKMARNIPREKVDKYGNYIEMLARKEKAISKFEDLLGKPIQIDETVL